MPTVAHEPRRQHRHQLRSIFGVSIASVIAIVPGAAFGSSSAHQIAPAFVNTSTDGLTISNSLAFRGEGDLAFVSQGRLFVLDGKADLLREVTTPAQQASDPQFSPNRRWLTYALNNGQTWLAGATGDRPREISTSGTMSWLPNGQLYLGTNIWSVSANGTLTRSGAAPNGLISWSLDGREYVFLTDSLKVNPPANSQGVERLFVASSLNGKQTIWYQAPTSFEPKNGIHGNFIERVTVLPRNEGLVLSIDPDQQDDADGSGVFEIHAPGATLTKLATTLVPVAGGVVSMGPNGTFAIGAGGDRYAWAKKAVGLCSASTQSCSAIHTSPGLLSLDPAWSPNHKTLAFIEAASFSEGNIGQPVINRWYTTHELALLPSGSSQPLVVADTKGAMNPVWSNSGKGLMYVSGDGLWLIKAVGDKPIEIVAPLFQPDAWPSYYGEVDWSDEFVWSAQ